LWYFNEKQTKRITQIGNECIDVHCTFHRYAKTAFLGFITLKLKFCFRGLRSQTPTVALPLKFAGGLLSLRLPENWTPSHKNPATPLAPTVGCDTHSPQRGRGINYIK